MTKKTFVLKKMLAVVLTAVTLIGSMLPQMNTVKAACAQNLLISENNYTESMDHIVEPYIERYKQTGYIKGKENTSLYYEKYLKEKAKGTIVISHGFTENLEKYDEMIYYFLKMGYSVYGMEHRGHARSGRLGIDAYQVNVESFSNYYEDLKTLLDQIVVPQCGKRNLYLFGHSMGGCIATRFLECYPDYFQAAILSSPMLEINSGSIPGWFAKLLAQGASITPYADKYVFNQGPYKDTYDFANSCTSSEGRYAWSWKVVKENPSLQMGGASYRWVNESYNGTNKATSKNEAVKVQIPVLLFQAGNDNMVGLKGQNEFAKLAKDCQIVRFDNAKHEIYFEKDEIVRDYLTKTFDFLATH